jgi:L-malate glycosyltransferase
MNSLNINKIIMHKRFEIINKTAKAINISENYLKGNIDRSEITPTINKLRIAYLMNHVRVCGGTKIILEHCNQLVDRGHEVWIICRDDRPTWKPIKATYIKAKQQAPLVASVPDVDIIVCTVADQLPESYLFGKAPVILFEQGDTYIYEFENQTDLLKEYYKSIWQVPTPIFGVSTVLLKTVEKLFNKSGEILHNALDRSIFFPRTSSSRDSRLKILFVGQEENKFKGVQIIRDALSIVRKHGYDFDEIWVAQTQPQSKFKGEFIENPTQERLGQTYRDADIFVSGSYYESFPLPPLEAMASGCAVVSTDNEGIKEYGIHDYNCILGRKGDASSLASGIIELLENKEKREQLIQNGYETANRFNWSTIMEQWEKYLSYVLVNNSEKRESLPSVKIQRIPKNISIETFQQYKNVILSEMKEKWCLFLTEEENVDMTLLPYIQNVISKSNVDSFLIPVIYPEDVPGHPIVRLEHRLYSKKTFFSDTSISMPINIHNSSAQFFMSKWNRQVIGLYQDEKFNELILYIKDIFTTLSDKERLVACRWMALGLIEEERYQDAFSVMESALELDISFSDLLYLVGRIYLINENFLEGKKFMELANFSGTSYYIEDAFYQMEETTRAYLEQI